ncbi:MAG TPA: sigma-70 family RNA polymerase sigma factor [Anaerolineales bacterium]|nr:sigma-70 family RNA polymerase sigma factor [Anaerolineales bacterium]
MSANITPATETSLIQNAIRGDLDAFNQLVLEYQSLAYNHAYALLGDQAAAQDATQDSFLRAFQKINSFRGGSFRAWLLRIVTNTAYDFMRRSRRHPTQPLFPEDDDGEEVESPGWLADRGPSVEASVEEKEFSASLYKILDELPDSYRSVLTLVDINELDYGEVAAILNIPIGTVKSRLARARLQVKERLRGNSKDKNSKQAHPHRYSMPDTISNACTVGC